MSGYQVSVVVVSDSVSAGKSQDGVIGVVKDVLISNALFRPSVKELAIEIVPDEVDSIKEVVQMMSENGGLVITCGGTGLAARDCTPEAVSTLIEKPTPGISQLMMSKSLEITPMAALSRPISGVYKGKALIVTLPGSPKAVKENLNAILAVVPHALDLIEGKHSSRKLHQSHTHSHDNSHSHDHGHSHSHSHSHGNDHSHNHNHSHSHSGPKFHELTRSVADRPRSSPYPMIPVDEAQKVIIAETPLGGIETKSIVADGLTSYVTAEDIYSEIHVPHYRASIVDGYAVVHSDCPGVFELSLVSHAAPSDHVEVKPGTIARVTTGAPVPNGATAVIPVEETKVDELTADGKEEKKVEILARDVQENDNIREIGSDVKQGTLILPKGSSITTSGGEIGLLASVGVSQIKVHKKPKIGVLSTGDELLDISEKIKNPDRKLSGGEIFDSNRPSLLSAIRSWGYEPIDLGIAKDTAQSLKAQIQKAYEQVDVLITTGGVSMGELDLLKPTIEENGKLHFGRVAMKPGKPTTFGTFDEPGQSRRLIFALPGNPASASVCFHLFVLPSLRKYSGVEPALLPRIRVQIESEVSLDPRPEYHRVTITPKLDENGQMHFSAVSTGFQRSSAISSMKSANGLLCLPSSTFANTKKLAAKSFVDAILIGHL